MREIKFRAWNKVDQTMYTDAINNCKDTFDMVLKHPQIYEVMQYTGLKDNNGREIYEGDIVERDVFAFGEIRTFTGEVKEYECAWWIDRGTAAVRLWNEIHELEVIGNIYENPELLEVKDHV